MQGREIFRQLCQWKGVDIAEGEVCPEPVHIGGQHPALKECFGIYGILKEKSSLLIFQKFGNMKFAYRNREFWCKGYSVDPVGKDTKAIKESVANPLQKDEESDPLSLFDPRDPFMGGK